MMDPDYSARTELLLGEDVFARLREVRVLLFGVGGVGSWCAEGLVRSGVKRLTLVDADVVSASNVNRQLMATPQTVGRVKVEALRDRLLEIAPDAEITTLQAAPIEQKNTAGVRVARRISSLLSLNESMASRM